MTSSQEMECVYSYHPGACTEQTDVNLLPMCPWQKSSHPHEAISVYQVVSLCVKREEEKCPNVNDTAALTT